MSSAFLAARAKMPTVSYRSLRPPALPLALAAAALAIALYLGFGSGAQHRSKLLFAASFPKSGLLTNEYAYYNPLSRRAVRSPVWITTSGSLFAHDGNGWTGRPDGVGANASSSPATDSAVFRLRTRRSDFGNVAVSFRLRIAAVLTTPRTPAEAYDGVHVWLRYQNPDWLYFASVSRRDGRIVIGKKLPTAAGGRYFDLVRVAGRPFPLRRWKSVLVSNKSIGHSVLIRIFVDGRLLAETVDGGREGPVILRPGRVGIRGDNAEFEFADFRVSTS